MGFNNFSDDVDLSTYYVNDDLAVGGELAEHGFTIVTEAVLEMADILEGTAPYLSTNIAIIPNGRFVSDTNEIVEKTIEENITDGDEVNIINCVIFRADKIPVFKPMEDDYTAFIMILNAEDMLDGVIIKTNEILYSRTMDLMQSFVDSTDNNSDVASGFEMAEFGHNSDETDEADWAHAPLYILPDMGNVFVLLGRMDTYKLDGTMSLAVTRSFLNAPIDDATTEKRSMNKTTIGAVFGRTIENYIKLSLKQSDEEL